MKKEQTLPGWRPDELLASAAKSRGLTVEEYRERIAKLGAKAASGEAHLTLQSARFAAEGGKGLSDEELAHLESCKFCGQLVSNIEATEERTRTFSHAVCQIAEAMATTSDGKAEKDLQAVLTAANLRSSRFSSM